MLQGWHRMVGAVYQYYKVGNRMVGAVNKWAVNQNYKVGNRMVGAVN